MKNQENFNQRPCYYRFISYTINHLYKRLLLSLVISITSLSIAAQVPALPAGVEASDPVVDANLQLRALFGGLNKPAPARKFLYEMAVHAVDTVFYNNYVTQPSNTENWYMLYEEIRNAAYDTTQYSTSDVILNQSSQYGLDTIPIGIINVDMYTFKSNALTTNTYFEFDTLLNKLTDKAVRPGFPYNSFNVFAASTKLPEARYSNPVYQIDPSKFITDAFNSNDFSKYTLKIDFGDGLGWVTISTSTITYKPVTYSNAGEQEIKVALFSGSAIVKLSTSKILVISGEQLIPPDNIIYTPGITAGIYGSCNSTAPEKIIIYLEDHDILDFIPKWNHTVSENYNKMIRESQLAQLRNYGYSYVVVDWKNSRKDIRENAAHLADLLNYLRGQSNNNYQFILVGHGMGGLVARFALSDMDSKGFPHNVRELITIDSPHLGSNLPLSIQQLYRGLIREAIGPIGGLLFREFAKTIDLGLDGTAARQMLINHVNTESVYNPTLLGPEVVQYTSDQARYTFMSEMLANEALYDAIYNPRSYKIVALSNGSLEGKKQTNIYNTNERSAGDHLLNFEGSVYLRLFGFRKNFYGLDLDMHTNPDGVGESFVAKIGKYKFKIKLKRYGIRVSDGPNSIIDIEKVVMTKPYCINAGGNKAIGHFGEGLQDNANFNFHFSFLFNVKQTGSPGEFNFGVTVGIPWLANGNVDFSIRSQGFHYATVPTLSALAYRDPTYTDLINAEVSRNILIEDIALKLSKTPFDVIAGEVAIFPPDGSNYSKTYNRRHFNVRNEQIAPTTLTCSNIGSYILNREIGDEILYLNNFALRDIAEYQAEYDLFVVKQNPHYNYMNAAHSDNPLSGFFSKDNQFVLKDDGNATFRYYRGQDVIDSQIDPQKRTLLSEAQEICCINFYDVVARHYSPRHLTENNTLNLFPNPSLGKITVIYQFESSEVVNLTLHDLAGRLVYSTKLPACIKGKEREATLNFEHLQLLKGMYVLRGNAGGNTQIKQVVIY